MTLFNTDNSRAFCGSRPTYVSVTLFNFISSGNITRILVLASASNSLAVTNVKLVNVMMVGPGVCRTVLDNDLGVVVDLLLRVVSGRPFCVSGVRLMGIA